MTFESVESALERDSHACGYTEGLSSRLIVRPRSGSLTAVNKTMRTGKCALHHERITRPKPLSGSIEFHVHSFAPYVTSDLDHMFFSSPFHEGTVSIAVLHKNTKTERFSVYVKTAI